MVEIKEKMRPGQHGKRNSPAQDWGAGIIFSGCDDFRSQGYSKMAVCRAGQTFLSVPAAAIRSSCLGLRPYAFVWPAERLESGPRASRLPPRCYTKAPTGSTGSPPAVTAGGVKRENGVNPLRGRRCNWPGPRTDLATVVHPCGGGRGKAVRVP